MMKLQIGYPSVNDELSLIMGSGRSLIDVEYVLGLVEATRQYPAIELGVSPRGSQDFIKSVKAFTLINGRYFVLSGDLQYLFLYIVSHRLKFKHIVTKKQEDILQEILQKIDILVER